MNDFNANLTMLDILNIISFMYSKMNIEQCKQQDAHLHRIETKLDYIIEHLEKEESQ